MVSCIRNYKRQQSFETSTDNAALNQFTNIYVMSVYAKNSPDMAWNIKELIKQVIRRNSADSGA